MHLLRVYDAAQLRGYPRIVRVPMCIFGLFSSVGQDGKGGSKCPSRMYHISGPGNPCNVRSLVAALRGLHLRGPAA